MAPHTASQALRRIAKRLPGLPWIVRQYRVQKWRREFPGSVEYWEERYLQGGTSGAGSYGALAHFKADVLNAFVAENGIRSVIELGCGDGSQLTLASYPDYLGLDVSPTAVQLCRSRFASDSTKRFSTLEEYDGAVAELALSLDVIYHLVEDEAFESHMSRLFRASTMYVAIYASNHDERAAAHVRHRQFSRWIDNHASTWTLIEHIENPLRGDSGREVPSDFWLYRRSTVAFDDP